ncbi:MAG TPA: hypothetical protein PK014_09625 [Thermoanaerobaculia bacterium]|mgnify:CR=1 FL=1|nr:hypothetical protein [Thermoanaerobaculia bacterium]HUM30082.1 hypothetical protein [Thermoanaerobaculia bacterium]HXK69422.1 hypothetical protein [Thermoanaerobaculia bacterium]
MRPRLYESIGFILFILIFSISHILAQELKTTKISEEDAMWCMGQEIKYQQQMADFTENYKEVASAIYAFHSSKREYNEYVRGRWLNDAKSQRIEKDLNNKRNICQTLIEKWNSRWQNEYIPAVREFNARCTRIDHFEGLLNADYEHWGSNSQDLTSLAPMEQVLCLIDRRCIIPWNQLQASQVNVVARSIGWDTWDYGGFLADKSGSSFSEAQNAAFSKLAYMGVELCKKNCPIDLGGTTFRSCSDYYQGEYQQNCTKGDLSCLENYAEKTRACWDKASFRYTCDASLLVVYNYMPFGYMVDVNQVQQVNFCEYDDGLYDRNWDERCEVYYNVCSDPGPHCPELLPPSLPEWATDGQ